MSTQVLKESLRNVLNAIEILNKENDNLDTENHLIDCLLYSDNLDELKELRSTKTSILKQLY